MTHRAPTHLIARTSHYGYAQVLEAIGSTALAVVDMVAVDWEDAFAE